MYNLQSTPKPYAPLIGNQDLSYVDRNDFSERVALQRLSDYDILLKEKSRNMATITSDQREQIEAFWRGLLKFRYKYFVNLGYYDAYNAVCTDKSKLPFYIPDSFFYAFVDEFFTNPARSTGIDDKGLYDLYFHDINRPKTIARKVNDMFLDKDYNPISAKEFVDLCKKQGQVIVKSAIGSWGGHGVKFWDSRNDTDEDLLSFVYSPNVKKYQGSSPYSQYVVQELLDQHKAMSAFNQSSVNTVRVITLHYEGKTSVLSSVLRLGVSGSRVDNCSSGGIVVGITDYGMLKGVAYNAMGDAFHSHPQSGRFSGKEVPAFAAIKETAIKLANRFSGVSRLISWDFAVDASGEPSLIEMNISFGEIDFHQLCNGPIFGSQTEKILKDICENNETLKRMCHKIDML